MNYTVVSYKDFGFVMAEFAKDTTVTIRSAKTPEGNIFFLVSTRNDATARAITSRKLESTPLRICSKLFPKEYNKSWFAFCAKQSYRIELYKDADDNSFAVLDDPTQVKKYDFDYADVCIGDDEGDFDGDKATIIAEFVDMGF